MSNAYIRVAIVDDDSGVRKALSRLLEVSSFGTETFASASEFLKSLPAWMPQCLIVDLQMPEMTGLELQYELKRRGINIPTIVITAHNEASAREKCELAGAIAFLLKPLQPDTLLATINAAAREIEIAGRDELL